MSAREYSYLPKPQAPFRQKPDSWFGERARFSSRSSTFSLADINNASLSAIGILKLQIYNTSEERIVVGLAGGGWIKLCSKKINDAGASELSLQFGYGLAAAFLAAHTVSVTLPQMRKSYRWTENTHVFLASKEVRG